MAAYLVGAGTKLTRKAEGSEEGQQAFYERRPSKARLKDAS